MDSWTFSEIAVRFSVSKFTKLFDPESYRTGLILVSTILSRFIEIKGKLRPTACRKRILSESNEEIFMNFNLKRGFWRIALPWWAGWLKHLRIWQTLFLIVLYGLVELSKISNHFQKFLEFCDTQLLSILGRLATKPVKLCLPIVLVLSSCFIKIKPKLSCRRRIKNFFAWILYTACRKEIVLISKERIFQKSTLWGSFSP